MPRILQVIIASALMLSQICQGGSSLCRSVRTLVFPYHSASIVPFKTTTPGAVSFGLARTGAGGMKMSRRIHFNDPEADALPPLIAIYTRYSHEEFQDSTQSQIDTCTDCAREHGWLYGPDLIFSDEGISGQALGPRKEMNRLLSLVEEKKAKFRGVVIDSSSRFARSVGDVSTMVKTLRFHGIFLYFVDRNLDSRNENFDDIVYQLAQKDEQFVRDLSHNVIRGQKRTVKNHFTHGGFYYGYRGEGIPDPTKRGTPTRPALKGVKQHVYEPEAEIIRQIFKWEDFERFSFQRSANECVENGYLRPYRKNGAALTWNHDTVGCILHNPMYKGLVIYGKTRTFRHPRTGKLKNVPRAKKEWTIEERPDLRIVSEEQWERVQQIIADRYAFGNPRVGAIARRNNASDNPPLFSGLLKCGCCKGTITVVDNRNGERILQCGNCHKGRKRPDGSYICTNSFQITESALERHVFSHIVDHLLEPGALEHAVSTVHAKLEREIASSAKSRKNAESQSHEHEIRKLEKELRNLLASLRELGPDEHLKTEYARVKSRLEVIAAASGNSSPALRAISLEEARAFVLQSCKDLETLLLSKRIVAQETLRSFVRELELTPTTLNHLQAFRITGTLKPLSGWARGA
jgi:site-specific DNA recombinase